MRRLLPFAALLLLLPRLAVAEDPPLPHAWLYGAWMGGTYPPPTTLSGQECRANPSIIFTREVVLHSLIFDIGYAQEAIEAVRATKEGTEFRFAGQSPSGLFGCGDVPSLQVRRSSPNEITILNCTDVPYPLVRCSDR